MEKNDLKQELGSGLPAQADCGVITKQVFRVVFISKLSKKGGNWANMLN